MEEETQLPESPSKTPTIIFYVVLIVSSIIAALVNSLYSADSLSNATVSTLIALVAIVTLANLSTFIYIRYSTFKMFKNSEKRWALYFYLNYLLAIPLILMIVGFPYIMLHPAIYLIVGPFLLALFVMDILLLVESYKQKPRLAYFWNLVTLLVIKLILSILS